MSPSSILSNFQGNTGKFIFEEMGGKKLQAASVSSKVTPWLGVQSLPSSAEISPPRSSHIPVGSLYLSYRLLVNINICKTVRAGTKLLRKLKSR